MFRVVPYIALGTLVYLILAYMQSYQPELLNDIIIQADVFGMTSIAQDEQTRIADIKNLPIPYEQKQVLIKRTVFIGATPQMLKLALGDRNLKKTWTDKTSSATKYAYYLPNDKRPTIFVFEQDKQDQIFKLSTAYKGSSLELDSDH